MTKLAQENFGGGIWRDLDAPAGYVYDAVNALVDGRSMFRRGGTQYKTTSDAPFSFSGMVSGDLFGVPRLLLWDGSAAYTLDVAEHTATALAGSPKALRVLARGVQVGDVLAVPYEDRSGVFFWGGSRKPTIARTGRTIVYGGDTEFGDAAESWLTTADAGMRLQLGPDTDNYVRKVVSNTELTMTSTASLSGTVDYKLLQWWDLDMTTDIASGAQGRWGDSYPVVIAVVGSTPRLIVCQGNRAFLRRPGYPLEAVDTSDFHELPEGAVITGAVGVRDVLLLFTTQGVWAVSNLDYDLTDDAGNPQQSLTQISRDVFLWAESGLAAWASSVVAPALDDIYLFSADGSAQAVSAGIRILYRSYVADGHRPGQAAMHRGHYVLPIIDSTTYAVVEVLVGRLDISDRNGIKPAWTRWQDHAAALAFANRTPAVSGTAPTLVAVGGRRVLDMTQCIAQQGVVSRDADGTDFPFVVETNDVLVGSGNYGSVQQMRLRYQMTGDGSHTPSLTASRLTGSGGTAEEATLPGTAPADDGTKDYPWRFVKRTRAIRFKIRSSGSPATLVLRSMETFVRASNRP